MAAFHDFNSCVTDRRTVGLTDGPSDRRTDTPSYRDARTHLKKLLVLALKLVQMGSDEAVATEERKRDAYVPNHDPSRVGY